MTELLNPRALQLQEKRATAEQDLSQRYLDLLKLRQQVRVALCGRVAVETEPPRQFQ